MRAGLASLGFRSMNELIGRADVLKQRPTPLAKTTGLDLTFLTTFAGETGSSKDRLAQEVHTNGPQLDDRILADPEVQARVHGPVHCWLAAGLERARESLPPRPSALRTPLPSSHRPPSLRPPLVNLDLCCRRASRTRARPPSRLTSSTSTARRWAAWAARLPRSTATAASRAR